MTNSQRWREFFILFFVQLFQYCIVCISYIALNKGSYVWTFATDIICGLNSFFIIRKIATTETKNTLGLVGYVLGGATGSVLAIWLTKRIGV
jgi:hypothetical protein